MLDNTTNKFGFLNTNPVSVKKFIGFGKTEVPLNTVKEMQRIIRESSENLYVRRWAEKIISNCPARDILCEMATVFYFCRDNCRYTHDIKNLEFLQTPPEVLRLLELNQIPAGDCDDLTMLSLSLLRSVGHNVAIRITGYADDTYSHVYGLDEIRGVWRPIDCIRREKPFGWEAPLPSVLADFPVN